MSSRGWSWTVRPESPLPKEGRVLRVADGSDSAMTSSFSSHALSSHRLLIPEQSYRGRWLQALLGWYGYTKHPLRRLFVQSSHLSPGCQHISSVPAPRWITLWVCMTQSSLGFLSVFPNYSEFIMFSGPLSCMCHKYQWDQEHLSPSWVPAWALKKKYLAMQPFSGLWFNGLLYSKDIGILYLLIFDTPFSLLLHQTALLDQLEWAH